MTCDANHKDSCPDCVKCFFCTMVFPVREVAHLLKAESEDRLYICRRCFQKKKEFNKNTFNQIGDKDLLENSTGNSLFSPNKSLSAGASGTPAPAYHLDASSLTDGESTQKTTPAVPPAPPGQTPSTLSVTSKVFQPHNKFFALSLHFI